MARRPRLSPFSNLGWIAAFLLALGSQGCALGDRSIALNYEPIETAHSAPSTTVALVAFDDARQQQIVGEVRNGFGMKMASIRADGQDVGAWVANAIDSELRRAGVNVRKFRDAAPPDIDISITGSVMEAYVRMLFTYRTTVRVQVSVEKQGLSVLNKEYTGGEWGMAWVGSASEYEGQLEGALQDLMEQLTPELLAAL